MKNKTILATVGELIDHLESLGRDRILIMDCYGNTDNIYKEHIDIWDPAMGDDSPVAIYELNEELI